MKANGITVESSFADDDGRTCYVLRCGVAQAAALDGAEVTMEADDGTTSTAAARSVTNVERVDASTTRVWLKDTDATTKDEEIASLTSRVESLAGQVTERDSTIETLTAKVTDAEGLAERLRARLSKLGLSIDGEEA